MNRQYNLYFCLISSIAFIGVSRYYSIVIHVDMPKNDCLYCGYHVGRKMMSDISKEEGKEIGFDWPLFDLVFWPWFGAGSGQLPCRSFLPRAGCPPKLLGATVVVDAKPKRMLLERGKAESRQATSSHKRRKLSSCLATLTAAWRRAKIY